MPNLAGSCAAKVLANPGRTAAAAHHRPNLHDFVLHRVEDRERKTLRQGTVIMAAGLEAGASGGRELVDVQPGAAWADGVVGSWLWRSFHLDGRGVALQTKNNGH